MSRGAHSIEAALRRALGVAVDSRSAPLVAGGCASEARRYECEHGPVFVKVGGEAANDAFAAEAAGLTALAQTQTIRTPKVLAHGAWEHGAFIALEWLDLGPATRSSEAVLGEQLAWLHRTTHAHYGWTRDTMLGASAQPNSPREDWVSFFREHRLRHQFALAQGNGADAEFLDRGERLCGALDAFFANHHPAPSLLHGDLWGGNWGTDKDGLPVIFDPAVYFGDRETDIAMTRLFGGFGAAFYAAYRSTWALDPQAEARVALYNLYHVLNHYNLFGGSYLAQARSMIDRLLAEAG